MLPILYLHGLSTGDFGPALRNLLGEDASGLSSSSIARLTEAWQAEHAAFRTRELADARKALERFREEFDAKYPKAAGKLRRTGGSSQRFH